MLYHLYMWMTGHQQTEGLVASPIFRSAMAIMTSFLLVLIFGGKVIRWLFKQKVGDRPEFHNATLNELTKHRATRPPWAAS